MVGVSLIEDRMRDDILRHFFGHVYHRSVGAVFSGSGMLTVVVDQNLLERR